MSSYEGYRRLDDGTQVEVPAWHISKMLARHQPGCTRISRLQSTGAPDGVRVVNPATGRQWTADERLADARATSCSCGAGGDESQIRVAS